MVTNDSLLEVKVKEHGGVLKEQFLLIFLSVVEGIFTAEKKATTFLSFFVEKSGFNNFYSFLFFQLVGNVSLLFAMYSSDLSSFFLLFLQITGRENLCSVSCSTQFGNRRANEVLVLFVCQFGSKCCQVSIVCTQQILAFFQAFLTSVILYYIIKIQIMDA